MAMAVTFTPALTQNAIEVEATEVRNRVRKKMKNLSTSICSAA